jgi:hypothetical protein
MRLRVAVPPATAEVDERASDGVWPSDTDVESRTIEAKRANWFDPGPRDFMRCGNSSMF